MKRFAQIGHMARTVVWIASVSRVTPNFVEMRTESVYVKVDSRVLYVPNGVLLVPLVLDALRHAHARTVESVSQRTPVVIVLLAGPGKCARNPVVTRSGGPIAPKSAPSATMGHRVTDLQENANARPGSTVNSVRKSVQLVYGATGVNTPVIANLMSIATIRTESVYATNSSLDPDARCSCVRLTNLDPTAFTPVPVRMMHCVELSMGPVPVQSQDLLGGSAAMHVSMACMAWTAQKHATALRNCHSVTMSRGAYLRSDTTSCTRLNQAKTANQKCRQNHRTA